jgi:hypothetical protein
MSESYRNVGIWTGPVRTIPLVIEVTSPKKPYLYSRVAQPSAGTTTQSVPHPSRAFREGWAEV